MDTDGLKQLAPHYLALLIIVFLVLTVIQAVWGEVGFWIELAVVLVIAFAYRPIVIRLGVAPDGWK